MPDHLYESPDRELLLIRRFIADEGPAATLRWSLRLPRLCWLGIRIPAPRLGWPAGKKPGDVDVVGGPLVCRDRSAWLRARTEIRAQLPPVSQTVRDGADELFGRGHAKRSREGTIDQLATELLCARGQLRPSFEHMFAFEVKVAWFGRDSTLHGAKLGGSPQKMARKQARGLTRMGPDHVGLLRAVVTEPCTAPAGGAWMHAGAHASAAADAYEQAIRARVEDPFATIVASIGAVPGRREHLAGSLGVNVPILGQWQNPLRGEPEVERARERLRAAFANVLEDTAATRVPLLVLACAHTSCGALFVPARAIDPWQTLCPHCSGLTTVAPIENTVPPNDRLS